VRPSWVLLTVAGFFVVPWGLFITALCTPVHDGTFVAVSLILALMLTPMGVMVLFAGGSRGGNIVNRDEWDPGNGT
jgi:hypothetical protein